MANLGTDLVTLLRDLQLKVTRGEPALIGSALGDAANEIERLKASIKKMAPAYEEWLEWQPDDSEALSRG